GSIPEGKLDTGEAFPAAAVREVAEETGYRVRLHRPLPAAVYLLPDGRTKIVQFWTATVRSKTGPGPVDPTEIDTTSWVGLDEAEELLTRQSDVAALTALRRFLDGEELVPVPIIIHPPGAARHGRRGRRPGRRTPRGGSRPRRFRISSPPSTPAGRCPAPGDGAGTPSNPSPAWKV